MLLQESAVVTPYCRHAIYFINPLMHFFLAATSPVASPRVVILQATRGVFFLPLPSPLPGTAVALRCHLPLRYEVAPGVPGDLARPW